MKKTKTKAAPAADSYFTLKEPLRFEGSRFKPSAKRPMGYRWYDPERKVLGKRSDKLNTLLLNGNDLLGVLNERRLAISNLLANTSVVAQQLTGLVKDNEATLAPTLQRLNSVLAMLENQRDNLSKALPGLAKFELTQGETVSSGFYYNAYVPNVITPQLIQPFFDYAFGFRRGTDAGQPPDNAGPRAEIPFPYNGIPQPNERWGQP